jgi:hypothetical protein
MKLPPSLLRRIQIRCFVRIRRAHRHYSYSRSEELDFYSGAMAVLSCFRDDGANALCDDWLWDIVKNRPIGDPSPGAQAIRKHEREEFAKLWRSLGIEGP